MNKWIFTFGCGQRNEGKYVEVLANSYSEARDKMVNEYGIEWAFQYTEEEWNEWCIKADFVGVPHEKKLKTIE